MTTDDNLTSNENNMKKEKQNNDTSFRFGRTPPSGLGLGTAWRFPKLCAHAGHADKDP